MEHTKTQLFSMLQVSSIYLLELQICFSHLLLIKTYEEEALSNVSDVSKRYCLLL